MASVPVAPCGKAARHRARSRALERSHDEPSRAAVVAVAGIGRPAPATAALAGIVSRVAERGLHRALWLSGTMERLAKSRVVAASASAGRLCGFRCGTLAAAFRELRHPGCTRARRDSSPVSRPAPASIHAGVAGHAVVPEQAD